MSGASRSAVRAIRSGSAGVRLSAATEFLRGVGVADEVLLLGASRGAVDDLARAIAIDRGVSFGLHRLSVTQLAARVALLDLAERQLTPVGPLASEALAARATFDATIGEELGYLKGVTTTPGFARALASVLTELRLNGVTATQVAALDRSGPDVAALLARFEAQLAAVGAIDRAALFEAATARLLRSNDFANIPVALLDVPFDSGVESKFLLTLARCAPRALITLPMGDAAAEVVLAKAAIVVEEAAEADQTDLARLHSYLFSEQPPPARDRTGELVWLSAPGEARECVEIARRILSEAARGVRFDEMAVLLHSPQQYVGLLEQALERAGIPAHFDRGTRRPDPGGRAFLALLACAAEDLSAKRFAEYLSLAQVPVAGEERVDDWIIPPDADLDVVASDDVGEVDDRDVRRIPAPWRWERLIVESSVVGGADRWERRLRGLAEEFRTRIRGLEQEDPDDPRIDRITRELDDLTQLQTFVLPLVHEIGAWPARATWGDWIARLDPLVGRALKQPARVRQVLAALRPMAEVGPVSIVEIRDVLAERLSSLEEPATASRYGRVFVASTGEARGRVFKVVFIAGLAERLFPRPIREDPLLLDDVREGVGLVRQEGRAARERLSLRLAVGAATERLYVSFPRVDAGTGRARVPSFYALELMRAVTGKVPDHLTLAAEAAQASGAALGWPAPLHPSDAIDDFEHDVSVLRELMSAGADAKGRAQYIVQLNAHLRRSLTSHWTRARSAWTPSDGIVRADAVRPMLETQRLGARPYSVSALQHYAACPYQFLLSAIYRFAPIEDPMPLQRLDPLTRGSLFHSIQASLFRALQRESLLPPKPASRARVVALLDRTIADVAAEYEDRLAPAIERVWRDEIAAMARDLHVWIDEVLREQTWEPWRFEFAFGLADRAGRDEHSVADPVIIGGRFKLRGSIDLVEQKRGAQALRVTDYKTSRNRSQKDSVVGGGAQLQPVLYSLAIEAATGQAAESARFWYCTTAGGFSEHAIAITDRERRTGVEVLEVVDRAVELGAFPPAPKDERTCSFCDFRRVCGPNEDRRVRTKSQDLLGDLMHLRSLR